MVSSFISTVIANLQTLHSWQKALSIRNCIFSCDTPRYSMAKNMPQIFTQSLTTFICAFSLHRVITAQGMILIFRKQALLVILGIKVMMEDSEAKAERVLLTHN